MAEKKKRSSRSPGSTAGRKLASALKSEDAAKRKAALEEAIKRKLELDKRALHMVESLIEEDITEEFFLNCGRFITPSHYKDTVDERFILQLCGYPLCRNKLKNVPKQKYKISTKTNKVYDITERKCFCSDFCFRASKYFEAQIPKNPIWLRDEERAPIFQLLREGQSGQSGLEIKLQDKPIQPADIENPDLAESQSESSASDSDSDSSTTHEQKFVSSFVSGKQADTGKLEKQLHDTHISKKQLASKVAAKETKNLEQKVLSTTEQLTKCSLEDKEQGESTCVQKDPSVVVSAAPPPDIPELKGTSEGVCAGSQVTSRGVSKKGAEHLRKLLEKSKQHVTPEPPALIDPAAAKQTMLEMLTQTLVEWRTDETLAFLYGSRDETAGHSDVPTTVKYENDELDEDDLQSASHSDGTPSKELHNSLDESLPFKESGAAVKPLPSYEKLQEETVMLDFRVREFFKGKYILPEEVKQVEEGDERLPSESEDVKPGEPFLPLIDSLSQRNIRKRIVLEKLKKVLPAILVPLDITYGDICIELNNLVKTFRLNSKNILHRTPEWSLIAVVLWSLLSPMIPLERTAWQRALYTQFISTLLKELHLELADLDSLIRLFKNNNISA